MSLTGLEGIVVGAFEKSAIVHTRGFGRVYVNVPDAPKMQLGDWYTLEADRNTNSVLQSFKWARTCPFICVKMPTNIPPILPTRLNQNKKGVSYPVVNTPVLVGTVKKEMAVGWSPQLGRISISIELLGAKFSAGDCFEGIAASVMAAEDVNGSCQWALRNVHNTTVDGVDWAGVREMRAVFHGFQDRLCILKADDGSLVSFGVADFVDEQVTPELVESYRIFTVWVGPALVNGDPVRAFLVKPRDESKRVSTSRQTVEETASSRLEHSVEVSPSTFDVHSSSSMKVVEEHSHKTCKGKELIKRLLADKALFDTLYATNLPLLHELLETALND